MCGLFLFLNFHYYKTKKGKSRFNQPQCPEEGWGENGREPGWEKYIKQAVFLIVRGGPQCAERWAPRTATGFFSCALCSPAVGAPATPRFPALANWRASVGDGFLPSPRTGRARLSGPCPGQGRRACRGRKKGGSVILLENKLHPFSIFIRKKRRS